MPYIVFLHAGISIIGLYPEGLFLENSYFHWPSRTKMQNLYQKLLKEDIGYQKCLRCQDVRDKNLEVLCSAISWDKVDLECSETVKYKPTGNNSDYITY